MIDDKPAQHWQIITLFPEFFASPLDCGLLGKALKNDIFRVSFINPRDFSDNIHRHVDDRPYGGGAGMVMQIDPMAKAIRSLDNPGRLILLSPRGRPFDEKYARDLSNEKTISLVCGRYEGIDERLGQIFPIEHICTGPYILNGGETAAMAVLEASVRLLPGFMGKIESASEESFSDGLLEYPHYTRPEVYEGRQVPPILLGGNHKLINAWRREKSLESTLQYRPEMLDSATMDSADVEYLKNIPRRRAAANFSFCLIHHPVYLENGKTGTSSLTNLDIHDIARISCSYGMGSFYVVSPLHDQLNLLRDITRHWTVGPGSQANPDRKKALELVRPAESLAEAQAAVRERTGRLPYTLASSAAWPHKKDAGKLITAADARGIAAGHPVLLCLGTARGLARELIAECDGILRPVRFISENHLSVRAAAAIMADRIFGDYC